MKYLKEKRSLKDQMIALTFYETAARVSELINMKIGDFYLKGAHPYVTIFGKEQKTRNVPLTPEFAKKLNKYILFMGPGLVAFNRLEISWGAKHPPFLSSLYSPISLSSVPLSISVMEN